MRLTKEIELSLVSISTITKYSLFILSCLKVEFSVRLGCASNLHILGVQAAKLRETLLYFIVVIII